MGLFSSKTSASSTWHAHVRIEKKGKAAEYSDLVSTRSHITAKEIEKEVVGAIISHSPHLKGGRVASTIRRVR